jgi:hypothetical protein
VSGTIFGAPTGLLQRLRRTEVGVTDLREAVTGLQDVAAESGLRLGIVDGAGRGPLLELQEAGRRTRVNLTELAVEMTRASVPATPEGISAALGAWLAHRPVPDSVAAAVGFAVLDWTDPQASVLGWRVVVAREGLLAPWRPSREVTLPAVHRTRSAALGRSAVLESAVRLVGPVALWTVPSVPGGDTALLVEPERMLAEMAARGLRVREAHLVVTPGRPVACAETGVARRLVAEATEACATVPWRELADLGWA